MSSLPGRDQIKKGAHVHIETKNDQGTGRLTQGIVAEILTSSEDHPHGIKVRLEDGQVGRVKNIDSTHKSISRVDKFENLDTKTIPKVEDGNNEFKEFYQYDTKMEPFMTDPKEKEKVAGLKRSVQERIARAVCSFGNSDGGFLYIGIKSDGIISGLEKDLKFGNFEDYSDSFANHVQTTLVNLLKDKVFMSSKLKMTFRQIEDMTICLIQILPADRPLYLNTAKGKTFFVRSASPKTETLDMDEQFRYIKRKFPDYQ